MSGKIKLETKRCTKCKKEYPKTTEYFNRNRNTTDGLRSWCKICVSVYNKTWGENNLERKRENSKRWYKKSVGGRKIRDRKPSENDTERMREWYRNNSEHKKEYNKKYWRDRYTRENKLSVVYFIQGKATTLVKIGHTIYLPRRYKALQSHSPDILEVIKTLPGTEELEKELHKKFKHCHHHGEWYNPTPELMEYINAI